MIKKLTFVFFVLTLCFKVNSQTKLFNDDGTYRTDGIYYFNCSEFKDYKRTGDWSGQFLASDNTKNYYFGIKFINAVKNPQFTFDYKTIDYNFYYRPTFYSQDKEDNYLRNSPFWSNLDDLKRDIIHFSIADIGKMTYSPFIKNDFLSIRQNALLGSIDELLVYNFKLENENVIFNLYSYNRNTRSKILLATSVNKLQFLEVYEMTNEYQQNQLAEAKRIQEEKDRINAIAQQKANAEAAKIEKINNDKRIAKIKTATVGDRLCYSESWTYTERSSGFFGIGAYDNSSNYKVIVVAYIEKIVNGKYQVRVGSIESTDKNHYQTPTYKGVKLREESIHWINPITDKNWYYCE